MAAGLDASTGGRVILGIGTGDPIDEPEHRAFGIPSLGKRDRRAHLAETVGALKALFASERWEGGRYVPAMAGPLVPAPRPGGPPVWIGAQADEMVRIAGALADGWNGWGLEAAEFGRKVRILQEEARAAGRVAEATWAGIVLMGRDDDEVRTLLEARGSGRERRGASRRSSETSRRPVPRGPSWSRPDRRTGWTSSPRPSWPPRGGASPSPRPGDGPSARSPAFRPRKVEPTGPPFWPFEGDC